MLTTAVWLLAHPDAMAAVLADLTLVANVVEEALRYDAPVQAMFRLALHDATVGGVDVPAGAMLMLLYGSANRDAGRFADADRFDPTRTEARQHLSFGQGTHFCAGAPFARAEGRIGLETILRRLDDITVAEPSQLSPPRNLSFILRGIDALHLRFTAAPTSPESEPQPCPRGRP